MRMPDLHFHRASRVCGTLATFIAFLTACPASDDDDDDGGTTQGSGGTGTTDTTTEGTGDGTGTETGETGSEGTDATGDSTAEDTGTDEGDNPNIPATCGNGIVDVGEVCDDGNRTTEMPPYAGSECIDDCSMALATCGNMNIDPGEECDDGNTSSMDACTTSCSMNTQSVHAACTRTIDGQSADSNSDITQGEITNCDQVPALDGAVTGCARSYSFFGQGVYAAQGDCQLMTLVCDDSQSALDCSAAGFPTRMIGEYDRVTACPAGLVLIAKEVSYLGMVIRTKVCLRACETDRDCRWMAPDDYWATKEPAQPYGQFRCLSAGTSAGERVCIDPRNYPE